MRTIDIGKRAEAAAAAYLGQRGYVIIGRNWRHRRCEIDIIAGKDKTIFFVEVKYRRTDYAGSGLEYVTGQKVRQMAFAANMWSACHHWYGPYQLSAIAVSGPDHEVTDFVVSID